MMNLKILFALSMLVFVASAQPTYDDYGKYNYSSYYERAEKAVNEIRYSEGAGFSAYCTVPASAWDLSSSLLANSAIVLFIMAMAVGLLYMAGNFFQIPSLLAMAKQEINELVLGGIIAAFFAFIIISPSLFGLDLFTEATNYSYSVLHKVSTVSSILISANVALNSVYTIYIPFGPVRKALTMQLGPALRPLIDAVSFGLQFLITTYGEWTIFAFMFCFIQRWFLPLFFPLGLFLRTIPHTRGGGNTLIAFAIALSTIYPLMFYIDSVIFKDQFPDEGAAKYLQEGLRSIFAQLALGGFAAVLLGFSIIFVSPVLVLSILMLLYILTSVAWEVTHLVVVFSILLPILNIFVTLSFAREIAKLLGTEINLSAFAKLI